MEDSEADGGRWIDGVGGEESSVLMSWTCSCDSSVREVERRGKEDERVRTSIVFQTYTTYFRRFKTSASSSPNMRASLDSTIL